MPFFSLVTFINTNIIFSQPQPLVYTNIGQDQCDKKVKKIVQNYLEKKVYLQDYLQHKNMCYSICNKVE